MMILSIFLGIVAIGFCRWLLFTLANSRYRPSPASLSACGRIMPALPAALPSASVHDYRATSGRWNCIAGRTAGMSMAGFNVGVRPAGVVPYRQGSAGRGDPPLTVPDDSMREGPPSLLVTIIVIDHSKRPLQWLDLAKDRLRLDRLCRNGAGQLSSPAGCAAIPRETRK